MLITNLNLKRVALSVLGFCLAAETIAAPFISEIHYDNTGTDSAEAIEISAETNVDLSGWSLVLYNGSNGAPYSTTTLSGSATEAEGCGIGGGTLLVNYSTNGIQNGSPDGIALVDASDNVVEFISYEGELTAVGGPADGLTSIDIGVSEASSNAIGDSLQLVDGVWNSPSENSYGVCTTEVVDGGSTPTNLSISEFHYDNAGGDVDEGIELTGSIGASIDGWQIVLYNGSNGTAYLTRTLAGSLVESEGCDAGFYVESIAGIQNGSPDAIALINPEGEVAEFISYEGILTATDGPASGLTSIDVGVAESASTEVGFSLQREGDTWLAPSQNTFGSCAETVAPGGFAFIHEIQGSGDTVTAQAVFTVEAVVVADYQNNAQLSGFFIQEEDSDIDSDPNTSEGIFVFCSTCETDVQVGDVVRVTGLANDFFDMSQITSTLEGDIEILSTGASLPSAATIDLPINTTSTDLSGATAEIDAFYETVEGMLVRFNDTLSVAEYFSLNRFGQMSLTEGGRPRQFTDMDYPSVDGYIAHQIDLASRRVILDDDNNTQNAALFNNTPIFFPESGFSADNFFRGGDTINGLSGVLHRSWAGSSGTDAWRIRPVTEAFTYVFESQNERTEKPEDVGGSLKVASFNVLNYFTTLDEGSPACGPDGTLDCRGANSSEELTRQTQKIVAAICAMDADIVGLMELQNPAMDAVETPIDTLVNAINASCPTYASINTGTVGGDAITVGIIYRLETVETFGQTGILDDIGFTDPNLTGQDKNRPAIARTFKEVVSERVLTVVVNHLKSKGSSCGAGDDDTTTGQANCNLTRTMAAQYQAQWLETNPTGYETENILIIGDLNAYRNEDPISAFINAGYHDAVDFFSGPEAYGYVFDGQLGYLDHALASDALLTHITGVTDWHINADEVNVLDYNDTIVDPGEASFDAKPSALPLFNAGPYRSSDHDPLVVGIQFPNIPVCHGRVSTIYVENGLIVGGIDDGKPYVGNLVGGDNDDVIFGTEGNDSITAGGGNDLICAGDGNDIVDAGAGHDIVSGDFGDDIINGGAGYDVLYGGPGADIITGGSEIDECFEAVNDCEK